VDENFSRYFGGKCENWKRSGSVELALDGGSVLFKPLQNAFLFDDLRVELREPSPEIDCSHFGRRRVTSLGVGVLRESQQVWYLILQPYFGKVEGNGQKMSIGHVARQRQKIEQSCTYIELYLHRRRVSQPT
jgi:hypothetical protein